MTAAEPLRSSRDDQHLIKLCDQSLDTLAYATNKLIDTNLRDLSMASLSLLTDAVREIRLARRYLHPEEKL